MSQSRKCKAGQTIDCLAVTQRTSDNIETIPPQKVLNVGHKKIAFKRKCNLLIELNKLCNKLFNEFLATIYFNRFYVANKLTERNKL